MPVDRKQPNSTSGAIAFWTWVERALKASCPAGRMEREPRKESPFIGYNMCSPRAKCNLHATCLSQAVIYEIEKLQAVRLDCPKVLNNSEIDHWNITSRSTFDYPSERLVYSLFNSQECDPSQRLLQVLHRKGLKQNQQHDGCDGKIPRS